MEMEKTFAVQECRNDEKIRYVAYLLQGKAFNWYQRLQHKYEQGKWLTLESFRRAFYDQYFFQSIRIQKKIRIYLSEQRTMTVVEYKAKLRSLPSLF